MSRTCISRCLNFSRFSHFSFDSNHQLSAFPLHILLQSVEISKKDLLSESVIFYDLVKRHAILSYCVFVSNKNLSFYKILKPRITAFSAYSYLFFDFNKTVNFINM